MKKKHEVLLYMFWGVITTVINFCVIYLLVETQNMDGLNANIIAWFVSNYVMFVALKHTVFHSKTHGIKEYIVQLNYYYISRIVTLAIEEIVLWKLVEIEGYPIINVKVFLVVALGILNLLFSKIVVFHCDNDSKSKMEPQRGYLV